MIEMRVMEEDQGQLPVNNFQLVSSNESSNTKNKKRSSNNRKQKEETKNNPNERFETKSNATPKIPYIEDDKLTSTHSERAIDCPTNFLGIKKEPPRYPRPLSMAQNPSYNVPNDTPAINVELNKPQHINVNTEVIIPSQRKSQREEEEADGYDTIKSLTDKKHKIQKYQVDLQNRKEQEEKKKKEDEMLRSSLRDSKKLLGLQGAWKNKSVTSCFNSGNDEEKRDVQRLVVGSWRRRRLKNKPQHLEIEEIVTSVRHVQKYLQDDEELQKLEKVSELVNDEKFQQLLKIHNKVVDIRLSEIKVPQPEDNTLGVTDKVLDELKKQKTPEVTELINLLKSPLFKNLLKTHEKIIEAEYDMHHNRVFSSELEDLEYWEDKKEIYGKDVEVKVVRLMKGAEPLGATVLNDGTALKIGRLVVGSVAWSSGLLREGDEVLDINGHDVRGMHVNLVAELMAHLNGKITFILHPNQRLSDQPAREPQSERFYRALFNYDPLDDHHLPCKDLGFSFVRGDILKVSDTSDQKWWQAYREGDKEQLAGLIPSPLFQQAKEELNDLMMKGEENEDPSCRCSHKRRKFEKNNEEKEYLLYEEVEKLKLTSQKRPIVILEPRGMGGEVVIERMAKLQPDLYEIPVKFTSKTKRDDEVEGKDFLYLSKAEFKSKIEAGDFIDYVSKDKHLQGVSYDAVFEVVARNRTCLFSLQPRFLNAFKKSPKNYPSFYNNPSFHDPSLPNTLSKNSTNGFKPFIIPSHHLMPYFVYLAPPNIEGLRQIFASRNIKTNDDHLKKILEEGRMIDQKYGHIFDAVIVVRTIESLMKEIKKIVKEVLEHELWVPKKWLDGWRNSLSENQREVTNLT